MVDAITPDEAGFRQWVAGRSTALRRKAYLLSGSWHTADDLVQVTLIATYAAWPRIVKARDIEAYVNRILVNKYVDNQRRPWRRERSVGAVPEPVDSFSRDAFDAVEDRDSPLAQALGALPAGQRAVLVLRYTEDLTVEAIADELDLPQGTVKSRLSRGSEAIRSELERNRLLLAHSAATSTSKPKEL